MEMGNRTSRLWVVFLNPASHATTAVGEIAAFRDDALDAHLAGMGEDNDSVLSVHERHEMRRPRSSTVLGSIGRLVRGAEVTVVLSVRGNPCSLVCGEAEHDHTRA